VLRPIIKGLKVFKSGYYKSKNFKTKKMKKKEFCNFVGIDVSKKTLDAVFIFNHELSKSTHQKFSNDGKGIKELISFVRKQKGTTTSNTLYCFEHTGIYGRGLAFTLVEKEYCVWIEMPVAILKSMGLQRGKSDKVDAKRIAIYAMKNNEKAKLWEAPRKEVELLRNLITTRERLVNSLKSLSMPIKECKQTGNKDVGSFIEKSVKNAVSGLKKDIEKIDLAIDEVINKDEILSNLYKLVTSIPGIGKITTAELICLTNEFKMYKEAKQLACYCGVAPFEHTSGSSIRGKTRVSNMANKSLKTKLHLCAMVAIQHDSELNAYYKRKVEEGKNKMLVINAVRNKLVHRIAAVIKRQTPFIKIAA
jgi:transposase